MLVCTQHSEPAKFKCIQCDTFICQSCFLKFHNQHPLSIPDSLIDNKKHNEKMVSDGIEKTAFIKSILIPKLDELECHKKQIVDLFKSIHDELILKEYKLIKDINFKIDKIMDFISEIFRDVSEIYTLTKSEELISNNTEELRLKTNQESDFTSFTSDIIDPNFEDIQSGQYSLLKDDFEPMQFIKTIRETNDVQDIIKNNDLLHYPTNLISKKNLHKCIKSHKKEREIKRMKFEKIKADSLNTLTKYKFTINNSLKDKLFRDIPAIYDLRCIDEVNNGNHMVMYRDKYIKETSLSYLYCVGGMEGTSHLSTVEVYDIGNDRWGVVEPMKMKRACSSSSIVSTKEHIFAFGGNDSLNTFERFSVQSRKWDCLDSIASTGGSSLAACYDKGRYIYLLGGIQNSKTLDRIDQFDILTGRSLQIGQLKQPRYYAFSFYHEKVIYTIGGTFKVGSDPYTLTNSIEAFGLVDESSEIIFDLGFNQRIEAACFDQQEYIYFINFGRFYRFSILSRILESLGNIPLVEGKFGLSLVFGNYNGDFRVYMIGGRDVTQFYYSLEKNLWYPFTKKNKFTYFQGTIGV